MKERLEVAEKSLLLSIPYLIILSLAYYWGYWGYFNIDAVSYYGVQDLIKGFTYTLPAVAILGILLLIGNKILDYFVSALRKRFTRIIAFIIIGIPFILFYSLYITNILPESTADWTGPAVLSMIILTILEALFMTIESEWEWAINNTMPFFLIKWFSILGIFSFFASYSYGRHEARNIFENKYFTYSKLAIIPDSTKSSFPFKYLGKAGEYYFFISPNNKEKRIISVQKIPNLILYNYDRTDTVSTHVYRTLIRK